MRPAPKTVAINRYHAGIMFSKLMRIEMIDMKASLVGMIPILNLPSFLQNDGLNHQH